MGTKLKAFLETVNEIYDLEQAARLLAWDKEAIMPQAATFSRIQQIATLRSLIHEKLTSEKYYEQLKEVEIEVKTAEYESFEACLVRYCLYVYEKTSKLSTDFVKHSSETGGFARNEWGVAREKNDYKHFAPSLEKVVAVCKEKAELLGYEEDPYDALLEDYERGITTKEVEELLDQLCGALVELREKLESSNSKIDTKILYGKFETEKQQELSIKLAQEIGYDLSRGYIATSVHPFAMSLTPNDVRITTRWNEKYIGTSVFGTLHEAGHAMYEQGVSEKYARTSLCGGVSLGIHESQSRFWENIVGRSFGFWKGRFKLLQNYFPDAFTAFNATDFYHAINHVHPGCIRVEADELTYNLHIILRFRLERALLSGELDTKDAGQAWNDGSMIF